MFAVVVVVVVIVVDTSCVGGCFIFKALGVSAELFGGKAFRW